MHATKLLSAFAALTVVGSAAVSTAAKADPAFGPNVVPAGYYQQYAGPPQCWTWSRKYQHWIWVCAPPPEYQPIYPQYYPYYQPEPFFGFFFGGGGFRDHDDFHHRR